MGVIQRGDGAGFALEALGELLRWNLDGHAAVKARVGSAEDVSHATLPERGLDPVRAEHGGYYAAVVRGNGRGRVIQRAGPVARLHHLLDLFAQSGIGRGQKGRLIAQRSISWRRAYIRNCAGLRET